VTPSLEAVGPRFYMAPELEGGRSLDVTPTADIYSLGKILPFMLSGGRIFSREKHNVPAWDLEVVHRDPRYGLFERIWGDTLGGHLKSGH
jgi:serine/threonine protein kinase